MTELTVIDEANYREVCALRLTEEQKDYVCSPIGILARCYAYRRYNVRAWAISDGEKIVGVAMVNDIDDTPACYTIQQFLIDSGHQRQGHGEAALQQIIGLLARERRYDSIEICVKTADAAAIALYKKTGFCDTGYTDPDEPDCYILKYDL